MAHPRRPRRRLCHLSGGETLFSAGDPGDCYRLEQACSKSLFHRRAAMNVLSACGSLAFWPRLDRRRTCPHQWSAAIGIGDRDQRLRAELHQQSGIHGMSATASRNLPGDRRRGGRHGLSDPESPAGARLVRPRRPSRRGPGGGRILIRHVINQRDLAAMAGVARGT